MVIQTQVARRMAGAIRRRDPGIARGRERRPRRAGGHAAHDRCSASGAISNSSAAQVRAWPNWTDWPSAHEHPGCPSRSASKGSTPVVTRAGPSLFSRRARSTDQRDQTCRPGPGSRAVTFTSMASTLRSPIPEAPRRGRDQEPNRPATDGGYAGASHPLRRPLADRPPPRRRISGRGPHPIDRTGLGVTRTFAALVRRRVPLGG